MKARLVEILPSFALGLFIAACGSPPAPQAQVVTVVAAKPEATPADVSAVAEPKNLVLVARVNKASDALKVFGGWTHLPMPQSGSVTEMLTGETLGDLVDLDQPIDFAADATPRGMSVKTQAAASVAIRSLDEAKRAFAKFKLTPGENGAWLVEGLGRAPGGQEDEGDPKFCALTPAFGAASTRLVCGDSFAAIAALGPYLTRTATRATYPSDVHVELRLEPVRPVIEQSRRALPLLVGAFLGVHRTGTPGLDEAWTSSVADLADLTSDLDRADLDAMIADPQATGTLTATFRGTTSFVARLATGHPDQADVPPPAFWRLPGDAEAAFFHRGIDAKDFERPRDHFVAAVTSSLEKDGLPEADREALAAAAHHTLDLLSLPAVHAKGIDVAEVEKALAAVRAAKPGDEPSERAALEKAAGWWAIGLEQEPAKVVATIKEWPAAWGRPGVTRWARTQIKDAAPPSITSAAMPKGLVLAGGGKDAAHLAITVPRPHHPDPAAKGKPVAAAKPVTLHVLVVPGAEEKGRTWLVVAADEALAVSKMKLLTSAVSDAASTLAGKGGLDVIKSARANAGGFVSPRAFVDGTPFGWVFGQSYGALHRDVLAGLGASPEKGGTAIPFTFTAQPGAGASPAGTFVARTTVPRAAIDDIVRLAMSGMRR